MLRLLIVALLLSPPAEACHDCSMHSEHILGAAEDGTWAVTWNSGTGETDYSEIWGLTIRRGTRELCTISFAVGDHLNGGKDDVQATGTHSCERLAGLGQPEKVDQARYFTVPHRDRRQLESRVIAALRLTPLQPTPAPAVRFSRLEDSSLGYALHLDGRIVGEVQLDSGGDVRYFPGGWAVSAYSHPGWKGLFLRLITLMPDAIENTSGKASECKSGYDAYLAVAR